MYPKLLFPESNDGVSFTEGCIEVEPVNNSPPKAALKNNSSYEESNVLPSIEFELAPKSLN